MAASMGPAVEAAAVPAGPSFRVLEWVPGRRLVVRTRPGAWSGLLAASGIALALIVLFAADRVMGLRWLLWSPLDYVRATPLIHWFGLLFFGGLAGFWTALAWSTFGSEWRELRVEDGALACAGIWLRLRLAPDEVRRVTVGLRASPRMRRRRGGVGSASVWVETPRGRVRALSWSAPAHGAADLNAQVAFLEGALAQLLPAARSAGAAR